MILSRSPMRVKLTYKNDLVFATAKGPEVTRLKGSSELSGMGETEEDALEDLASLIAILRKSESTA